MRKRIGRERYIEGRIGRGRERRYTERERKREEIYRKEDREN